MTHLQRSQQQAGLDLPPQTSQLIVTQRSRHLQAGREAISTSILPALVLPINNDAILRVNPGERKKFRRLRIPKKYFSGMTLNRPCPPVTNSNRPDTFPQVLARRDGLETGSGRAAANNFQSPDFSESPTANSISSERSSLTAVWGYIRVVCELRLRNKEYPGGKCLWIYLSRVSMVRIGNDGQAHLALSDSVRS
jgi:hypothetical protein